VLRGLNEKFAHMKAHFKCTKPFPSFERSATTSSSRRSTPARPHRRRLPPSSQLRRGLILPALPLVALPLVATQRPTAAHQQRRQLRWQMQAPSRQRRRQDHVGPVAVHLQHMDRADHHVARSHGWATAPWRPSAARPTGCASAAGHGGHPTGPLRVSAGPLCAGRP
jgi:hypothetical protein